MHFMSGFHQIGGHAGTHMAKADKGDFHSASSFATGANMAST